MGLLDILVETLTEIGDNGKSYPFKIVEDNFDSAHKDEEGFFNNTYAVYEFEDRYTNPYGVDISWNNNYSGTQQDIQIDFGANGSSKLTNANDIPNVMKTIVEILKDAYKIIPFKNIAFTSATNKNKDVGERGAEQRTKLYLYFLKKEIPNAKVRQLNHSVIITLPDNFKP